MKGVLVLSHSTSNYFQRNCEIFPLLQDGDLLGCILHVHFDTYQWPNSCQAILLPTHQLPDSQSVSPGAAQFQLPFHRQPVTCPSGLVSLTHTSVCHQSHTL